MQVLQQATKSATKVDGRMSGMKTWRMPTRSALRNQARSTSLTGSP